MKLVFMGTPDFAVPSLQALIDGGYEISAVFTQPDKPKGRGMQLAAPPVKELALKYNIPVHQPRSMKTEEALQLLAEAEPDLVVVAAFGKILPKAMLELPRFGCINVHGSLLPKYRGAAPIQRCILESEKETGVTIMQMAEGLDTGDIISMAKTPIDPDETAGELFDRIAEMGAKLLTDTLPSVLDGTAVRTPQNDAESCYASMLTKEMSLLDFSLPAEKVHDTVRGLSPWPVAYTVLGGRKLKVHRTKLLPDVKGGAGELLSDEHLIIGCGEGGVELLSVQAEGKKRVSGEDFLHGARLKKGARFGE